MNTTPEPLFEQRLTIGLLIGSLSKEQAFLPGAAAAARQHGVNLICRVGKNLNWGENSDFQGNILYELVNTERIDGFITWAGVGVALGQDATPEQMARFFQKLKPRPVVNYEKLIPGLHTIRTDTALAMEAVLRHMIAVHKRRKILLVRGPANHFETEERVRAYQNILAEYKIPPNPALILPPFGWENRSYEGLISRALDERQLVPGLDFDAIAGTEPYLACSAIRVLQSRGVNIPGDVGVAGFNESPENLATTPPVTTARKPFFNSGYQAVEILLDLIAGKKVPEDILIPAELVLRRSCGCISQTIVDVETSAASSADPKDPKAGSEIHRSSLLSIQQTILLEILTGEGNLIASQLPADWAGKLWSAFVSDMDRKTRFEFIEVLTDLVNRSAVFEEHLVVWNRILTRMRANVRPMLDGQDLDQAETLWQQARIHLVEAGLQAQYRLTIATENQRHLLDVIGMGLNSVFDLDSLIETLIQALPRMGIPSCYLSLYTNPQKPEETAQLILAYRDYQNIPLEPDRLTFPSAEIVPRELLPQGRSYVMVVEPLYLRQRQLGFIAFEMTEGDGSVFEILQRQISSALDRMLIEQDFREREAQFQAMTEAAPIGILLVDLNGTVTYQNPVGCQLTGLGLDGMAGQIWFQMIHPDDLERVKLKWETAVQTGQPFNDVGRYLHADTSQEWWDVRMAPIQVNGKTLGFVGMTQDISERLQMEEALKTSEERYRLMIEAQAEGVGFVDRNEIFRFMNPAGEAIFGVQPGTLIGRSLLDFLDKKQTEMVLRQTSQRARGKHDSYEIMIARPDGKERHLMITVAPSFDVNNSFTGSFGIFRDITERKLHEQHLYYLSTRDSLTGIYNRAYFEETLARLQQNRQSSVSVLVLDVDQLKKVNDSLGHAAGDEMLRRTARVLKASFRSNDLVCRIGGDEFAVFIPNAKPDTLQASIERVRHNLAVENAAHHDFEIHFSIGGATAQEGEDLGEIVKLADQAMYREKGQTRTKN